MRNHALATGKALCRLIDNPPDGLAQEISEYAEMARVKLHLDNSAVTAAVMFAQPLVEMWKPEWKFAYTVGVSLGAKFTTEGFYICDIINHLTDEFPLEALKMGERIAVEAYDWLEMNSRCRIFRNALLSVALEDPLAARNDPAPAISAVEEDLHVLIVDDSAVVCELHVQLVRQLRPGAEVHCCSRCARANPSTVVPSAGITYTPFDIRCPGATLSVPTCACSVPEALKYLTECDDRQVLQISYACRIPMPLCLS